MERASWEWPKEEQGGFIWSKGRKNREGTLGMAERRTRRGHFRNGRKRNYRGTIGKSEEGVPRS